LRSTRSLRTPSAFLTQLPFVNYRTDDNERTSGDLSVVPTRYFLGKPPIGEEMHISIDQGKTLIVKLLATGPINQQTGIREVFFELNGEVRAVAVEDKSAAIEVVQREKATSDPGSVGVCFFFSL
jgi:pyruvate carboxylase